MSSINQPNWLRACRLTCALAVLFGLTYAAQQISPTSFLSVAQAQATQPNDGTIYALTANNNLIAFNSVTPGTITRTVAITGLTAGEMLLGIDFRPNTNQLYAVSSANRLYSINTTTGAATVVGAAAFTPALNGTVFGFNFNPAVDRIRLVSDAEQNLRLHPDTGVVAATDSPLAYAASDANVGANPNVVGVAYTNSFRGTTSTTLYGIDSNLDALVRQGSVGGAPVSPNGGQLFTVGALGVNTTSQVGFDILAPGDTALAALTPQGSTSSSLYSINLLSGTATLIGTIGGNQMIRGLAVPNNYAPTLSQVGIAAVNAASFNADALAPEMISALFGNFQTQNNQTVSASALPLPTTLAGVKVSVNGTDAPLFFVSPSQINFLVPANAAEGVATLVVTNSDGTTRTGTVTIKRASPGIFTRNSSGRGTLAGLATTDGITYESIINPDGTERPVSAGTAQTPNWIVVFGTGIRNAPAANPNDTDLVAEAVTATIQGIPAWVTYAGPSSGFPGVDQLNVVIPPQLAGAGQVTLRLTVNGIASNAVTFTVGGTAPAVTFTELSIGQAVSGTLTTGDQLMRAGDETGRTYFFDAYRFTGFAGQAISLEARSEVFDPSILLYRRNADGSLRLVAADKDLGGLGDNAFVNGNALLFTVLPESGEYVVYVTSDENSPNATGAYTLRARGNAINPIAYGAMLNGTIGTDDLQTAAGVYIDAYSFNGAQGDNVQIKLNSTAFDAMVALIGPDGTLLNADDNGGGGQNALLTQRLLTSGTYVILVTPFTPNRTGDYTLMLTRLANATTSPLAMRLQPNFVGSRLTAAKAFNLEATASFEHFSERRVVSKDE